MVDKHMNEEAFMKYLATKVTPAQLSAMYWCYREIEVFFQRLHLLDNSLFETTDMDVLTKVQKSMERNKFFKIKFKKQYTKMMTAWEHYYRYIKEGLYSKDEPKVSALTSTNTEAEIILAEPAKVVYAEDAAGEQAITLEDRLHDALKNESEQNKYGTTLLFLQQKIECRNASTIRSILQNAKWAKLQYGRYFYVGPTPKLAEEKSSGTPAEKAIPEISSALSGTQMQSVDTPPALEEDEIIRIIKDAGLGFVDKRGTGGCLWVIADGKNTGFLTACKAKGYEFQYTVNGSKSTDYKPAWYLATKIPASIERESKNIDELLHDEDFRPLRDELARQNITTLEALRVIKLWPFMNRYNLYSIGKRQAILTKVQALLKPETNLDDNQLYILHIGSSVFKGVTAAEAYLHFCEDMAQRYPLQFRTLIGARMSGGDAIPIFKSGDKGRFLKLENINAYISADLPATAVLRRTRWICGMCGKKNVEAFIDEPQKPASESKLVPIPSAATTKPAPAVQTVSEQPQPKKDNPATHKIEKYVLKADMDGVSYDDVKDAMGLTMVATRQLISEAVHIVDIKGRLIHEDAFIDWEDGANRMEAIIDKLIQKNNGYISCNQLYEYVRSEMNMFLNDNDVNEERAVYDIARHLFEKAGYHGKHYRFYGNTHISRPEDAISSNFDIIKKYAAEQGGIFSFAALGEYLESVGLSSGNLRAQMRLQYEPVFFYCDEGILMFSENMHIDEAWKASVKTSLEALFSDVGDHIILREIPAFWFDRLPPLPGGRLWTPLLLQGILRFYSEELGARTILAMEGQNIETLHAMLVSNDSPIQGFGDVVISYLAENEVEQKNFEAEELRWKLVNAGILKSNELIWNMHKALKNDGRFAWDVAGSHVTVLP